MSFPCFVDYLLVVTDALLIVNTSPKNNLHPIPIPIGNNKINRRKTHAAIQLAEIMAAVFEPIGIMKINTDNSTNAAIAVMAAIELGEKLTGHPLPLETKATLLEIFLGIGLWFTGKPSPTTNRILNHLGIANDLAVNDTRDRSTAVPGGGVGHVRGNDAGLNAGLLDTIADSGDYGSRGDRPDPDARVGQYWADRPSGLPVVGSPKIEGAGISAVEYSVRSRSGGDDDQSGVFKGQDAW